MKSGDSSRKDRHSCRGLSSRLFGLRRHRLIPRAARRSCCRLFSPWVLPILVGFIMGPKAPGWLPRRIDLYRRRIGPPHVECGRPLGQRKEIYRGGQFRRAGLRSTQGGSGRRYRRRSVKDTAGPSLNTLITVMSLVANLFARSSLSFTSLVKKKGRPRTGGSCPYDRINIDSNNIRVLY